MIVLPLLSIMLCLPLAASALLYFNRNNYYIAITSAIISLALSLYLGYHLDPSDGYQFVEKHAFSQSIGLYYHLGIDGLSLLFVVLTNLLTLSAILVSLRSIKVRAREYLICFLLLQALSIGFFCSMNLLLFYFFFEIILIPMYLIIGIWGGENRVYAAIKFFLYTLAGSLLFLIALIFIHKLTGTFDIIELNKLLPELPLKAQQLLWLATFIAFAVKIPMFPFHTWLPDPHVQAPTAGSVILAGILLKIGGYGMIRVSLAMLPLATEFFATGVVIMSVIAIIYGSLVAMSQTDMKKMIAYSSVAHMGYVTAGIFSLTVIGIQGAIFQMISHGLISAGLFLVVGMLYERHHTKEIAAYGGFATTMPVLAIIFMICMLGSVGLPGTSGFIGEFSSLVGIFEKHTWAAVAATSGVVLGAIYMLKLYRDVMLGENKTQISSQDITSTEILALLPLIISIIITGIYPNLIMQFVQLAQTLYG